MSVGERDDIQIVFTVLVHIMYYYNDREEIALYILHHVIYVYTMYVYVSLPVDSKKSDSHCLNNFKINRSDSMSSASSE